MANHNSRYESTQSSPNPAGDSVNASSPPYNPDISYSKLPIQQITAGNDVSGIQFPTYKRPASDIMNLNSELLC